MNEPDLTMTVVKKDVWRRLEADYDSLKSEVERLRNQLAAAEKVVEWTSRQTGFPANDPLHKPITPIEKLLAAYDAVKEQADER